MVKTLEFLTISIFEANNATQIKNPPTGIGLTGLLL